MTRKKHTSKFKVIVVLEALKERSPIAGPAQEHELASLQTNLWKRGFSANADILFKGKGKSKKLQADEERNSLLKGIGQQKLQMDFLNNALR